MNKEKEVEKKEEQIFDKEFFSQQKNEDIEIKKYETASKINETNAKMGKHLNLQKSNILDNSTKRGKILRTIIVGVITTIVILGCYFLLKYTGTLNKFNSLEDVKDFILSGGNFSIILFVILQFLQVTFLPIPAFITTIAGALIFGPWTTFFLSLIAIMFGSLFAFWLGRKFGKSILCWIAGKDDTEKWTKKLTNGKYAFFLMMLFPAFPDDILCIAAGVTNMSWKFFTITNLITRPIGIFCLCFIGSGNLISYSGWGLIVWAVLIILLIIAFIISIKYQNKIENIVDKLNDKLYFKKKQKPTKITIQELPLNDGTSENNN